MPHIMVHGAWGMWHAAPTLADIRSFYMILCGSLRQIKYLLIFFIVVGGKFI